MPLALTPARPDQLPLLHHLTLAEPYFWHIPADLMSWEAFIDLDIKWWLAQEGADVKAAVSLGQWDAFNRSAALGMIVLPEARRSGVGTAVHDLALDLAFKRLGLHRLAASVREENEVIWRGMEKRGWTYCGFLRECQFDEGEWKHRKLYERINPERKVS